LVDFVRPEKLKPEDHFSVKRAWQDLDKEEQTGLLVDYGRYQDDMPNTCDLLEKEERFTRWLAVCGVSYQQVSKA